VARRGWSAISHGSKRVPAAGGDEDCFLRRVVPAALFLAGLLGDIAEIEILVVEEERPAEGVRDDIGSRPGLGNGRDPSLQAADADQLLSDFDPSFLLIGRGQYLLEMLVVSLDERAFVQDGERRGLGAATSFGLPDWPFAKRP
jgi:hypothetical protein